ncbi:MAG: hypothetical protein U9R04_02200 [Chloroflexota bacterium]|nr:hypothetical protein [Chloroflexota bacterium]
MRANIKIGKVRISYDACLTIEVYFRIRNHLSSQAYLVLEETFGLQ